MNRQTQVTDQTRTNLREAFWELYAEKSIEKITVREITDRAGYNRATFYLYYRDVYDVLEQVEDTVVGGIESLVNDRLMRGESLDFTEHMGTILQLSRKYSSYIAVLLGDNGDPAFANRFKEAVKPLVGRFVLPVEGVSEPMGAGAIDEILQRYPSYEAYFADEFGLDAARLKALRDFYLE